ncbi:hypothetical protein SCHPADRAFT_900429 [Schizopora paradoxa]|uniref:Uncharacterized protein n=1 Tax=Schizopora paradoxa TaxID=27342 RepID=A0A0H2S0Z6_9AGAM|nr:hypothetical protein SCHPADRAFT_900429 [Schizopora paradoxa]
MGVPEASGHDVHIEQLFQLLPWHNERSADSEFFYERLCKEKTEGKWSSDGRGRGQGDKLNQRLGD